MGEIKSTLDLVMEKTKHLSQSAEEKQAQLQMDTQNRLKGILQKYQDGLLSLDQLQAEHDGLKAEVRQSNDAVLAELIIDRLDPDQDNGALFEVLDRCCRLDPTGLEDLIKQYQAGVQTAAQSRMAALKESLAEKHKISGTAVVPNLETDDKWRRESEELRAGFEGKVSGELTKLLAKTKRITSA